MNMYLNPPSDDRTVQMARAVAYVAHHGQQDKAGALYFDHCHRVARRVMRETDNFDAMAAAYLHDVVEDTELTLADLEAMGFPVAVLKLVAILTRDGNESHEEAVRRAAEQPLSRIIKRADVADNSDPHRLAKLDATTQDRLMKKYARAHAILTEHEPEPDEEAHA